MTRAVDQAANAADVVQGWFSDARKIPADRLTNWKSVAGDRVIEFVCTDERTAKVAATRLINADTQAQPFFRLGLLETGALGWAPPRPCESEVESLALTKDLADRGIVAIIPVRQGSDAALPWVAFDTATRTGFVIVCSVEDLPPWMMNAPFSLLLHLAFAVQGQRLLHAASLGHEGRGALMAGPGRSGKSATTISGLLAGLSTVGDDYLVMSFGDAPMAYPVYRVLKQDPFGLSRFPTVRERVSGLPLNWHGKVEFDAELARVGCIVPELAIDVILIPRRKEGSKTTFTPATPTAAFSALAPSTLSQLPGLGLEGFTSLTRLTRALPAFWLDLSADPMKWGRVCATFSRTGPGEPS